MPRRDTKFHVLPNVQPEDVYYYVSIWSMHYTCMIVCPLASRRAQMINICLEIFEFGDYRVLGVSPDHGEKKKGESWEIPSQEMSMFDVESCNLVEILIFVSENT